ncbi:MAG: hypothetical protein J6C86_07115, partial [Bacteroidaceae bacterium]|nr:hypothetical protein [Bacteroidaceae bacterium]
VSTYQSELNVHEPLVGMHPGASAPVTCFFCKEMEKRRSGCTGVHPYIDNQYIILLKRVYSQT